MPQLWETSAHLEESFERAGVSISPDQLRRWRDKGLMPSVEQVGLGRAAGSVVRYPLGTVQLAIEINKLLGIKRKSSFVGWQLWMQGNEVAEEYWKPMIISAAQNLKRIPGMLRLMERQNQSDSETIYDQLPMALFAGTPFAKGLSRLSADMRAFVFGLLADVAQGRMQQQSLADQSERRAIINFIGQSLITTEPVAGIFTIGDFAEEFEKQLSVLSETLSEIQSSSIAKICGVTPEARIEFSTLLDLASQLAAHLPGFSKSPIGRFASAIRDNQATQAYALVVWTIFTRKGSVVRNAEISNWLAILNSKSAD